MSANKPVVNVQFCSVRDILGSTSGGSYATCRSTAWHAKQAFKLTTHHRIAFAGRLFQPGPIKYFHVAARVSDDSCLLEQTGYHADTGPVYAQHGGQELLSDLEFIALYPVMRHQ
jgi:hypothetical protein